MQSSYQYHFGGQAAAARNADSPSKSPQKSASINSAASQSQGGQSSMFVPKVDWGGANASGGAAAASGAAKQSNQHVPFGFGGGGASFGGGGASFGGPSATNGAAKPSFGGPSAIGAAAASSGLGLSSQ